VGLESATSAFGVSESEAEIICVIPRIDGIAGVIFTLDIAKKISRGNKSKARYVAENPYSRTLRRL